MKPDDLARLFSEDDVAEIVSIWGDRQARTIAERHGCDCTRRPRRCTEHGDYADAWVDGFWAALVRLGIVKHLAMESEMGDTGGEVYREETMSAAYEEGGVDGWLQHLEITEASRHLEESESLPHVVLAFDPVIYDPDNPESIKSAIGLVEGFYEDLVSGAAAATQRQAELNEGGPPSDPAFICFAAALVRGAD